MRPSLKPASLIATAALFAGLMAAGPSRAGQSYTYDALGRLSTVTYDSGLTIAYAYDAAGNRTSKVVSGVKVVVMPWGSAMVIPVN